MPLINIVTTVRNRTTADAVFGNASWYRHVEGDGTVIEDPYKIWICVCSSVRALLPGHLDRPFRLLHTESDMISPYRLSLISFAVKQFSQFEGLYHTTFVVHYDRLRKIHCLCQIELLRRSPRFGWLWPAILINHHTDTLTYNSNRGWLIRCLASNQHDDCVMTDRSG